MDSVVTCLVFAGTVRVLHLSVVLGPDGHIRYLGFGNVHEVLLLVDSILLFQRWHLKHHVTQLRFEKELSNWAFSATCATNFGNSYRTCSCYASRMGTECLWSRSGFVPVRWQREPT